MPECPDCEVYVSVGRRCRKCGWKAEKQADNAPMVSRYQDCSWVTVGHRCTMPATIYPHPAPPGAKGLCLWHWKVKYQGIANTFSEFSRWQEFEVEHHYCSNWTHYDVEYLWRWTQGECTTTEEHPCRRGGCIVIYEQDQKKPPLPPLTPEETAEKFRELYRILSKSPMMQPVPAVVVDENAGW